MCRSLSCSPEDKQDDLVCPLASRGILSLLLLVNNLLQAPPVFVYIDDAFHTDHDVCFNDVWFCCVFVVVAELLGFYSSFFLVFCAICSVFNPAYVVVMA